MNKKLTLVFSVLMILGFAVSPAMAQTSTGFFSGHVTSINTSAAATSFDFTIDNAPSGCNGFVFYIAPSGTDEATAIANSRAALATLLVAQVSGHTVSIIANLPTSSSFPYCTLTTLVVQNN